MKNKIYTVLLAGALMCGQGMAETPQWWIERGVLNTNWIASDYALVNQGQVKWMAEQAGEEFNEYLPGSANSNIQALVSSFTSTNGNYLPANIGQLKYNSTPFHDRLIALGLETSYPWASPTGVLGDYAIANIGQLKYVFDFDLRIDGDSDGMPDGWEIQYGLDTADALDADEDPDLDGVGNLDEFLAGTNPVDTSGLSYSVLYVDPQVDVEGTGTFSDPFKTISAAVSNAVNDDCVILKRGLYTGSGNENISFNGIDIKLIGLGGWQYTTLLCANDRAFVFNNGETADSLIKGITIRHGRQGGCSGGAVYIDGASPVLANCVIEMCNVDGAGGAIYVKNSSLKVSGCVFRGNKAGQGAAVYMEDSAVNMENCSVKANTALSGGIIHCAGTSTPDFVNNTIIGNDAGEYGSVFVESTADASVFNTIAAFNTVGIKCETGGTLELKNNCVYSNIVQNYSGVIDPTGTDGNISEDPLLESVLYGCICIASNSPCRDAGTSNELELAETDLWEQTRLVDDAVDIGALEYQVDSEPIWTPNIVRVDSVNGDDANDGSSWANAKQTIQAAVESFDFAGPGAGGEIRLKQGVYTNGTINLDRPNIAVVGGYEGTEDDARSCDPALTRISGNSNARVIYCTARGLGACWLKDITICDGFVMTQHGGGIYILNSNPIFKNCVIRDNEAKFYYMAGGNGGGVACIGGRPQFRDCVFCGNESDNGRGGGSAVFMLDAEGVFKNCLMVNNYNNSSRSVVMCNDVNVSFINCTLACNSGGYLYWGSNSSIYSFDSSVRIANCILWNNDKFDESLLGDGYSSVSYSVIQGGYSGAGAGSGILNSNPAFAAANGNCRLLSGSCCFDSGNTYADSAGLDYGQGYGTHVNGTYGDSETVDIGYHYSGYTQPATDVDADGLSDCWEREYLSTMDYGSDYNPDGDGWSNLEEYNGASDPDNVDSYPAMSMLKAAGADIVDIRENPVHLRAENIGGWLAWEQWMQNFKPLRFTNQLGRLVGEGDRYREKVTVSPARYSSMSGVSIGTASNVSVFLGFNDGDYVCLNNVIFDENLTGFVLKNINRLTPAGRYEIRLDSPTGTLLAEVNAGYTGGNEEHIAAYRGYFTPQSGTHNLYIIADIQTGESVGKLVSVDLIEIDNKASAEELYDLLIDNVDSSLMLYATNAAVKNNVTIAYDCEPDGIGSYHDSSYIEFQNVTVPAGMTNLSAIAGCGNTNEGYNGRFKIEFIDSGNVSHLYGVVPVFKTGGWSIYDEMTICTGACLNAGVYRIRVTGLNDAGQGDVANLHSLRFFKTENARTLVDEYRDAYFSTNDLQALREMGFNCVRIPFNYDLVMRDDGTFRPESDWTNRLDWVVNQCNRYQMYCLLDLHGVPGGQSDYEQCMRKVGIRNRLWYVDEHQERIVALWEHLAEHYNGNSAVIGYDIINEPAPWWHNGVESESIPVAYNDYILPLHRRIYAAIRSNDTEHLIFMEDNAHMTWNSRYLDMLPSLYTEQWTNVVYEIHSYEHVLNNQYEDWRDGDITTQKVVVDENIRNIQRFQSEKKVPVFIGEFQPQSPDTYDYALQRYRAGNIHWCHWNFRTYGWMDAGHPETGGTCWGLDYRSKATTNLVPNLCTNELDALENAFAQYNHANYEPYASLQQVVCNNAARAEPDYCEFYLNTFSSPDGVAFGDRWPWNKIAGIGSNDAFKIENQQAKLKPFWGAVVMRWKSRVEADARFQINDETGCWFVLQPCRFDVTNRVENPEAEVRLAVMRDEVNFKVKDYKGPGLIARMEYDADATTTSVNFYVYCKTGGSNTWGSLLFSETGVPFSTNALRMHVSSNSLTLIYNNTVRFTTNDHRLNVNDWVDGAVCVTEAEDVDGNTKYIYLDNFRAWREDAAPVASYEGSFTNAPDGMRLRAWMEDAAVYRNWSTVRDTTTYITNGRVILLPEAFAGKSTWMNARKDFQNDVRLDVQTGEVAEINVAIRDFTHGYLKIGLLPEYFPGLLWDGWSSVALYLEMSRSGGLVKFKPYRTYGAGGSRTSLAGEVSTTYDNTKDVVIQVNSNKIDVYYGSTLIYDDVAHGLNSYENVYPNGMLPHIEFQSGENDGYMGIDALKCKMRNDFGIP